MKKKRNFAMFMDNSFVKIEDKIFKQFISAKSIAERVKRIAESINQKNEENVVVLSVMNGAFMFTSDLCKLLTCKPIVSFIKVSSYVGTHSECIHKLIGFDCDVKGKIVYIVEDIVDTGKTVEYVYNELMKMGAKAVHIVAFLLKTEIYKSSLNVEYVGSEIENKFVIGYGMDYNGWGRAYKDIYVLI